VKLLVHCTALVVRALWCTCGPSSAYFRPQFIRLKFPDNLSFGLNNVVLSGGTGSAIVAVYASPRTDRESKAESRGARVDSHGTTNLSFSDEGDQHV
jgi:hypothetical protein